MSSLSRPTERAPEPPGHTDLMISPEAIMAYDFPDTTPLPPQGTAVASLREPDFHAGHAMALHMVLTIAREGWEPTGDRQADDNVRNAFERVREIQRWLEPLAIAEIRKHSVRLNPSTPGAPTDAG